MSQGNVTEVAAGLVFRGGLLLIAQRKAGEHLGGLWEFPGGKRLPNESFQDCLRRELLEELGIEVEVGELVETIRHEYSTKTVRLEFFRCRWTKNEPQALGCSDFAWVDRRQLETFSFPAADARLLQRLKESADFWK
jgi:mutator protein MutT